MRSAPASTLKSDYINALPSILLDWWFYECKKMSEEIDKQNLSLEVGKVILVGLWSSKSSRRDNIRVCLCWEEEEQNEEVFPIVN